MRILWNNLLDDYAPLASSERTGFPATNAQHVFLSRLWRTLALDEYFTIDAGAGLTITADCALIAAHNLTAGATIHIQAHPTNDWGAPDLDETITWDAGNMVAYFASTTKRFWRFQLADAANPDGYIEVGRLAVGTFLQMPPVEPGSALPSVTTTVVSTSITGQTYGDRGQMFLAPGFAFPIITQTERGYIEAMWREVEQVTPVFLDIWEDSPTVQRPIYCRIDQDKLDWQKAPEAGLLWSVQIAFMEAK